MFGFIVTKKRIYNILIVTFLSLAVLFLVLLKSADNKVDAKNLEPATDKIERIAFIENLGYKVDRSVEEEKKQIVIPYVLNDVLKEYLKIQKQGGFSPEKFAGEKVDFYTYKLIFENRTDVYAHLIVADGKIIGGDISALSLDDGFMNPLKPI